MLEDKEIKKFAFHIFDRYEIQIQAFVDLIKGKLYQVIPRLRLLKLISGHSSSSTFHDLKVLSFLIIKMSSDVYGLTRAHPQTAVVEMAPIGAQ